MKTQKISLSNIYGSMSPPKIEELQDQYMLGYFSKKFQEVIKLDKLLNDYDKKVNISKIKKVLKHILK